MDSSKFTLPALPYEFNALEKKGLNERTVTVHYTKHHQGYVNKLNAFTEDKTDLRAKGLEWIIKNQEPGKILNCAGQIYNHTLYWNSMSPNGGGAPTGAIKEKITAQWGSFEKFQTEFTDAAKGHFGSGWVFLCADNNGKLSIVQSHDAGCPLRDNLKPLMCCDVWEHAYYLQYANRRDEYVKAWWNLVNWDNVNKNLA